MFLQLKQSFRSFVFLWINCLLSNYKIILTENMKGNINVIFSCFKRIICLIGTKKYKYFSRNFPIKDKSFKTFSLKYFVIIGTYQFIMKLLCVLSQETDT